MKDTKKILSLILQDETEQHVKTEHSMALFALEAISLQATNLTMLLRERSMRIRKEEG